MAVVAPIAERQSEHRRDREARRAAQLAPPEADVLEECLHAPIGALDGLDAASSLAPATSARAGRGQGAEWMSSIKWVVDDAAADEVFLDDPLEHRRIALAVPGAFRIDDGDRAAFADAQAVRLGAQDAALLGQARALSAAASGSPTPRGRDPCRSISASSDRSRERCAAARRGRRSWQRSLVGIGHQEFDECPFHYH